MDTALTTFCFDTAEVRALSENGAPRFVATDIARALGYRDAGNMVRMLDEDERGYSQVSTPSGEQRMLTIAESGLYQCIFGSQRAEAKRFRRWITGEVIPALRTTGHYDMPGTAVYPSGYEALDNPTRHEVDTHARHQAQRTMAHFQHVLGDLADTLGLSPDRLRALDVEGLVRSGLIDPQPGSGSNVLPFRPTPKRVDRTGAERQRRLRARRREQRDA